MGIGAPALQRALSVVEALLRLRLSTICPLALSAQAWQFRPASVQRSPPVLVSSTCVAARAPRAWGRCRPAYSRCGYLPVQARALVGVSSHASPAAQERGGPAG